MSNVCAGFCLPGTAPPPEQTWPGLIAGPTARGGCPCKGLASQHGRRFGPICLVQCGLCEAFGVVRNGSPSPRRMQLGERQHAGNQVDDFVLTKRRRNSEATMPCFGAVIGFFSKASNNLIDQSPHPAAMRAIRLKQVQPRSRLLIFSTCSPVCASQNRMARRARRSQRMSSGFKRISDAARMADQRGRHFAAFNIPQLMVYAARRRYAFAVD